jgi:adenylate kinase
MFRSEVASGSELGKIINEYISNGLIVPIDIAIKTIITALKSAPTEIIIIDGYPRSIEQMEALDSYLIHEKEIELINVIEVVVSEKIARDRVLGRSRGEDDKEEVFNNRMQVYIEPLEAIQSFYGKKQILHKINGERDIKDIVRDMNNFIISKI